MVSVGSYHVRSGHSLVAAGFLARVGLCLFGLGGVGGWWWVRGMLVGRDGILLWWVGVVVLT